MAELAPHFIAAFKEKPKNRPPAVPKIAPQVAPDAPGARLAARAIEMGELQLKNALGAWECRLRGQPIIDIAHGLGLSIEGAKALIKQAHEAVYEDAKENLELNRTLDLQRIDSLLSTYLPLAREGSLDAANFTVKCIGLRAKLTGLDTPPQPARDAPTNLLVWIQNQLPQINQIVDALPLE